MRDPYLIDSPTCISFSGGRTSAYMLWRVLQSNNGLPADAVVCFANTGKEEEATLDFVRECGERWDVPITWVEYRNDDAGYAIVTHETASRNGEPFEAIIRKRNYLPNPVTRFCTIELKIRAMAKHLFNIGLSENKSQAENMSWIGIRADEARRAAKIEDKSRIPLVTDRVTLRDIESFWSSQPFKLELPTVNGRTLSGNCDLCFLKAKNQIYTLIQEKPSRAEWWARMEATSFASKPYGALFRFDRASYAQMAKNVQDQRMLFDVSEESIPCFCGD